MHRMLKVGVFAVVAIAGCQSGLGIGEPAPPPSSARMEYIAEFKKIDTSGRGQISIDQATAYYAAKFKELDANGDGFLDAGELEPLIPVMNARSGKELISRLARSSDVRVSHSEFLVIVNWLFQMARSKDVLTLADVEKG